MQTLSSVIKNIFFHNFFKVVSILFFLFATSFAFAQNDDDGDKPVTNRNVKGFHAGVYLGSFFANKSTTGLYDGYGYDTSGLKNEFSKSFMYNSIVIYYGGGNGQTDQIAQALNVNHGDWNFDQTDMPVNLKYNPSVAIGLHALYCFDKKNALLLNATGTKLTLNGNFTITLNTPPIGPQQPNYENIKTFSITGAEKRAMFQLGYQRIFGENAFSFFAEGGAIVTMAKFVKNQIAINNLVIDFSNFYNQPYYATYRAKYLSGIGVGAFAGFGFNYLASLRYRLQLIYNPSYEKVSIGPNPRYKIQNAVGLRVYYQLK